MAPVQVTARASVAATTNTTAGKLATILALIGFSEARHLLKPGAARRRIDAAERAFALQVLGMQPEQHGPMHPESYCASTGELIAYVREACDTRNDLVTYRADGAGAYVEVR